MTFTKNILLATLLATVAMVTLAPTLSIVDTLAAKPDKTNIKFKPNKEKDPKDKPDKADKKDKEKVKNCNVKAQLKVYGAAANSTVTAQLETLIPQSAVTGNSTDEPVTFMFQWKKGDVTCPTLDELPKTVYGTANAEYFTGLIKSLTKPNKITYELQGITLTPDPIEQDISMSMTTVSTQGNDDQDSPSDTDQGFGNDLGNSGDAHKKNSKRD
jgi:hypothetical protein